MTNRFNEFKNAGASIPFYNISGSYNPKKGASFGYGNKVTGVRSSDSPGPGKYESSISNSPKRMSKYNNGKFGVGYDRFHLVRASMTPFRPEILTKESKCMTTEISQAPIRISQITNSVLRAFRSTRWLRNFQDACSR